MNDQDVDNLLQRSLSGDPPGPAFRARVLRASSRAFVLARRGLARWRLMALTTAAVLIAGVSFLGGRYSARRWEAAAPPGDAPVAMGAAPAEGIAVVPSEMVAWVNAARLFRQLGMEDRVGRALDRAGRLMPPDAAGANAAVTPAFPGAEAAGAGQPERPGGADPPERHESFSVLNRVMAYSLGDRHDEN